MVDTYPHLIRNALFVLATMIFIPISPQELHAGYIYKNGKLYNEKYTAKNSCEEHFNNGLKKLRQHDLISAEVEFKTILESFPDTIYATDSLYYLGVVTFERSSLDIANRYFSEYLQRKNAPEHYEDLFRYKLAIASRLASGEKRHLFGYESLPKIMTGHQIAKNIFSEIIKAIPYQEIAAEAMIEKGNLLVAQEEFPEAIESYQEAIRKFPKTSFSKKAFLAISETYLQQIACEPQNNDILALAEINLREAQKMFPYISESSTLQKNILKMKELFASALYEIGELYERMKKPQGAMICYSSIVQKYPETEAAAFSHQKMKKQEERKV